MHRIHPVVTGLLFSAACHTLVLAVPSSPMPPSSHPTTLAASVSTVQVTLNYPAASPSSRLPTPAAPDAPSVPIPAVASARKPNTHLASTVKPIATPATPHVAASSPNPPTPSTQVAALALTDTTLVATAPASTTSPSTTTSSITPPAVASPPVDDRLLALIHTEVPRFRWPPQPPRYPSLARRRGQEGTVLVDVWLGADGSQQKQALFQSSGVAALDEAALDAVRDWQFLPTRVGAETRASRVRVPVSFALR